jgi:hypothetical protein
MAGYIAEFFGYRMEDDSDVALAAVSKEKCPILGKKCSKILSRDKTVSGVCAVRQKTKGSPIVICCPVRLYADGYKLLRLISRRAFNEDLKLYPGRSAVEEAKVNNGAVAVFGNG